MIFLGYNFLQDSTCWLPTPTGLNNLTFTEVANGIYDHVNISSDVDFEYITTYPTTWDTSTILNATFNGTINAGNVDYVVSQISSIKIKRRLKGTYEWHTLYDIPINSIDDMNFTRNDYLAQSEVEYEYALVPIIGNVEGQYITNSMSATFYGVFITDGESIFRFKEGASYTSNERVHATATYEPYGSQYPVVVSNGQLSYDKGTVNGSVIVLDSDEQLDRKGTVDRLQKIKTFLATPNAKVLKDLNGNIWLVSIVDNLPINYYSEVGMAFAQISFNWVEIGDANNGTDLLDNNLILSNN